jgi:hypothetical protein
MDRPRDGKLAVVVGMDPARKGDVLRSTKRGGAVPGPFIFVATNRLKPGKPDEEKKRVPCLIDFVHANEPRLIAFNEYANEDGTEVAVVQVHPDADSMAFHIELIAGRAASAYAETIDATTSIEVFGTPSKAVVETLRHQAGADLPPSIKPYHLGGFTR